MTSWYSARPVHPSLAVLCSEEESSLCCGSIIQRWEMKDRPRGLRVPRGWLLPHSLVWPALATPLVILALQQKVGFFFQLLQPVNMTMASVDNGVHGGGGRPGSALAGVPSAVPSLVQRFGVPCWLSGAEPSACSGPSCCPQQASLPPAEGHPVLRGPAGSVSSGGWADGLSAVLE